MTQPYAVVADIHAHDWSAFATVHPNGMNSRLKIILDELERAGDELLARGGQLMTIDGDVFHARGKIDPEVFNPTQACLARMAGKGIEIVIIPGNHDLKGSSTTELGSAVQTLAEIDGVSIANEPVVIQHRGRLLAFVPWCATLKELREKVAELKADVRLKVSEIDLHIHAGIDGVLAGVRDHGLSAKEVDGWGFKRVFAGHYHNFKELVPGRVISIGATTHQTFSDIGAKAGFLLVHPNKVEWRASHAPSFVELTPDIEPEDYQIVVDGNYVRVRSMKLSDSEIIKFRKELMEMGARAVTFQVAREVATARAPVAKASTLEESVGKFVDKACESEGAPDAAAVKSLCADILTSVQSVSA
jgi:DNA repair exonuclease SbcCD nuclease subunit